MPGTFVFKPIEANLQSDKHDPYCKFIMGDNKVKSQVSKEGGSRPHWNDALVLTRDNEDFCEIQIKNKDGMFGKDIGAIKVLLTEVEKEGKVSKWYDIMSKDKVTGQLLLEVDYNPFMISDKNVTSSVKPSMPNQGLLGFDTYGFKPTNKFDV